VEQRSARSDRFDPGAAPDRTSPPATPALYRAEPCSGCTARDREIDALREEIRHLAKENEEYKEKIAQLNARVRKNSQNSSLPPSSDMPSVPKKKCKPKGRRPGGQPGHQGTTRELVPTEQATEVILHFPEICEGCGKRVAEKEQHQDLDLAREHRHQQWDIPPIVPLITEHQCHQAQCSGCGTVTRATFPESVTRSMFGPHLMALVVLLTGVYRMSKRNVAALLSDVFGTAVSIGSISNIEKRMSRAFQVPVEILKAMVQMAKVVYADETGWKERAKRMYIWVAVASFGAIYLLRNSRAAKIARELLGSDPKYVVTDRYSGYSWLPLKWRQICWAHLIRDFKWIMGFEGEAGRIGTELLDCAGRLFHLWHQVQEGSLKRSSFRTLVSPVRKRISSLLEEGVALDLKGVSGMCKKMLEVHPAFYTFVRVEGIEPTNNNAETRQRHPAMWRRVSFGTWSKRGSEYVERILSVVATLRIQKRNIFSYLGEASRAALQGKCAPLLVPFEEEAEAGGKLD